MDSRESRELVDLCYRVGIVLFIAVIVVFTLFRTTGFEDFMMYKTPDCYIERTTGIFCPGCGMSRAVFSLFRFKILKSFLYNGVPLYGAVCYIIFMTKELRCRYRGRTGFSDRKVLNLIYIGIGFCLLQWIIKLVCFLGFGIKML